jgi:hypothetical protein
MSQWTSFVAVEKRVVNIGGKMRTIAVPVEMADGVSYDSKGEQMSFLRTQGRGGLAGGGGGGVGTAKSASNPPAVSYADSGLSLGLKNANPELKIHKSLRDKTGKLEVMVLVASWPADWKKKLEEAGLKIDGEEKDLKVLFGTLDAKTLLAIAKLDFVTEIKPLE